MALVRWDPSREISSLQQEMNRLFGTFFDTPASGGGTPRRWIPAMDLVETADSFVLRADLPGMTEDQVQLEMEDNVLTVSGERQAEHEDRSEGYYRIERAAGAFSRSLTLPDGVDPQAVSAHFEHGVLEVTIPKPAERKPRRLAIQVGGRPAQLEGEAGAADAASRFERPGEDRPDGAEAGTASGRAT